mmetsp:Transcript_9032/g.26587  ORF Transcript_9032/g.26587 Transcript_9032/m.26587 type:complete len:282 (+) Transcript_9032:710-1555(+)
MFLKTASSKSRRRASATTKEHCWKNESLSTKEGSRANSIATPGHFASKCSIFAMACTAVTQRETFPAILRSAWSLTRTSSSLLARGGARTPQEAKASSAATASVTRSGERSSALLHFCSTLLTSPCAWARYMCEKTLYARHCADSSRLRESIFSMSSVAQAACRSTASGSRCLKSRAARSASSWWWTVRLRSSPRTRGMAAAKKSWRARLKRTKPCQVRIRSAVDISGASSAARPTAPFRSSLVRRPWRPPSYTYVARSETLIESTCSPQNSKRSAKNTLA